VALLRFVVVIVRTGATVTVMEEEEIDCAGVLESVALMVNVKGPAADRLPVMAPVAPFKARPVGKEPLPIKYV
jgi:hypothetical protein